MLKILILIIYLLFLSSCKLDKSSLVVNLMNVKTTSAPTDIPKIARSYITINKVEISLPLSVGSADCSAAVSLIPKDENNSAVTMDRDLSVSLSASGSTILYSDSACTSAITESIIPAGSSNKTIYIKSSTKGSQTITTTSTSVKSDFLNTIFVKGITKVSAGNTHTCAVFNDGAVKCWGANGSYNLIGDGTTTDRYTPTLVSGISNAIDVVVGARHACALLSDQTIKCWGGNTGGSLGSGNTTAYSVPVAVVGINSAVSVVTNSSAYHSCALLDDQTVRCWGGNFYGQIGDGTLANARTPFNPGFSNVKAIAVGDNHTCLLFTAGNIKCVGSGYAGQLGDGTIVNNTSWVDVGITTAAEIYASLNSTCAKLLDGTLKCWGSNGYGRLADSAGGGNILTPKTITVPGGSFLSYVSGANYGCILLPDHTVSCAGANESGEFGNFSLVTTTSFSPVSGISNVTQLSAGSTHLCALLSDSTVKCWGNNNTGQAGDGTKSAKYIPVQVPGLTNVENVNVGNYHTCVLLTDETGACSGWDQIRQLGHGGTVQNLTAHGAISGLTNATEISAQGLVHNCAVISNGTVKCWGYNNYGQLGDGTSTTPTAPVLVSGINSAIKTTTGYYHSCALLSDQTIKCWGYNNYGQLGDGTNTNSLTAVSVSTISTAVDIISGNYFTCAILADTTVQCWGFGIYGQLGNSAYANSNIPVSVTGLTNVVAMGTGVNHACAVLATGAVRCWGQNNAGQLGDNTLNNRNTPNTVLTINNATKVAGSNYSTCAVLADGTASCWGENLNGQLGNNTTTLSKTPVAVLGLTGATKIAGNFNTSYFCAIKSDKTLWCWGYNMFQMGLGASDPDVSIKRPINLFD